MTGRKNQTFVDQLRSVFTKMTSEKMPIMENKCKKELPPLIITVNGVIKLLLNINISKSTGPDKKLNIILKNCAQQIAPWLCAIFWKSLDAGELPEDWINAKITPVYEKGDAHLPENYRPISLTSVSCKLLEHIICRHLMDHLERNKILTNLNLGFRSGTPVRPNFW